MLLRALSQCLLNTDRHGASTTSLSKSPWSDHFHGTVFPSFQLDSSLATLSYSQPAIGSLEQSPAMILPLYNHPEMLSTTPYNIVKTTVIPSY